MQAVVIGTHPTAETTVGVGPFRSPEAASRAWDELTRLGYVAETVYLERLADLDPLEGFGGED